MPNPETFDISARLFKSGTPTAAKTALNNGDPSFTDISIGANNDLWGETWTPAEINAGLTFGAVFNLAAGQAVLGFEVDAMSATVYYASASGARMMQTSIGIGVGLGSCGNGGGGGLIS